jgi:hypothetical protein
MVLTDGESRVWGGRKRRREMNYKITKKYSEKVVNEIFRIYKEKGLSAEMLVKEAEKKSSPLHSLFQWDEKRAAHQWRLQQARVIIWLGSAR